MYSNSNGKWINNWFLIDWLSLLPLLYFMYVCIFSFSQVAIDHHMSDNSGPVWHPYSHRLKQIMCIHNWGCVVRELWSALVGWRHSVQPSEPLFIIIHLQSGWRGAHRKSQISFMSQYLSGGTMEWICFADSVLCGFPFLRSVLGAIVFLIPHILFMLNLLSMSQVWESV